jgi:sugar-specific transcriptional regulator TrmB
MYVDAEEVSKDWGVSKPKAYKMIKELKERMLKDNPILCLI